MTVYKHRGPSDGATAPTTTDIEDREIAVATSTGVVYVRAGTTIDEIITKTRGDILYGGGVDWGIFDGGSPPDVAPVASGTDSIALGDGTTALATNSFAAGKSANAGSQGALALGSLANASGSSSISIGPSSDATNGNAIAMGNIAQATQLATIALGQQATANGSRCIAIGPQLTASGASSISMGWLSSATGTGVALGQSARADVTNSVSLGRDSDTANGGDIAIGSGAQAVRNDWVVIGGANNPLTFVSESNVTSVGTVRTLNNKDRTTFDWKGAVRTTDATPNTAMGMASINGSLFAFKVTVIASDGVNFYHRIHEGLASVSLGTTTVHSVSSSVATRTGLLLTADSDVIGSGADLVVEVTGELAKTIDWSSYVEIKAMEQ